MSDIVQELNDAAESKSGASLRHGCVECGLSSAMCSNAADEIDKLRAALVTAQAERDAARQALARRQHQKGCPSLGIGGAVERNCTCGVNALRAELDAARQNAAAAQAREEESRGVVPRVYGERIKAACDVLRAVEWRGTGETCPACGGYPDHASNCRLVPLIDDRMTLLQLDPIRETTIANLHDIIAAPKRTMASMADAHESTKCSNSENYEKFRPWEAEALRLSAALARLKQERKGLVAIIRDIDGNWALHGIAPDLRARMDALLTSPTETQEPTK